MPARNLALRLAIVIALVAGCSARPGVPSDAPQSTPVASTPPATGEHPPIAGCPNFVETVESGPMPGDDGSENGPVARGQARIRGDVERAITYGAEHRDEFASVRFENGPRVRMVIGFTAHIAEHCAALRSVLGYPDEFEIIRQPATEARLEQIETTLTERYRGVVQSVGLGAGVLQLALRADGEKAAAEVRANYGDLVEITVGMLPYPDRFSAKPACALAGPIIENSPLVAVARLHNSSVSSGADFTGKVTVRNTGSRAFDFQSGPRHRALVFPRASGTPVGFYTGGMDAVGFGKSLAPGESVELDVLGGTASCDPALGYALPAGEYDVRVPVVVLTLHDNAPTDVAYILSPPIPLTVLP